MRPTLLRRAASAFVLGAALSALAQPRIELYAAPAWRGWSRPGRATEVEVRLRTEAATRATLELAAGLQTLHTEVDLQPGRTLRLHLPTASAARAALSVAVPGVAPLRRELAIAESESPLLGVALAAGGTVDLDGFHPIVLAADDLPRNALAYSSIDALLIDAATLVALDPAQLGALMAHAAGCGRIVVVDGDERVRRAFAGAGGCGGRALLNAPSLVQARQMLDESLATSLPEALPAAGIGEPPRPALAQWNHLALVLGACLAAIALAAAFALPAPLLVATSGLAAIAALALLHLLQAPSQLDIWSEAESGAAAARYQAWQHSTGLRREQARVPVPPQLGAAVRACDAGQPMRLDFDAGAGRVTAARFESRLFRRVSLCYAGSFPITRSITVASRADGTREVVNAGASAWPRGRLVADGLVHDLPALAASGRAAMAAGAPASADAAARTASMRVPPGRVAALWPLDLGGVTGAPIDSQGWLLVSATPR